MGRKTPAMAYYTHKMQITSKSDLMAEWNEAPITSRDINFLCDIIDGKSLKELASKYYYTVSGIAKWKRKLYTKLHRYDMRKL